MNVILVISSYNMNESKFKIRQSVISDFSEIKTLYQTVAKTIGGIARTEEEITDAYVKRNIENALAKGISFVVEDTEASILIGEIHCYKLEPKVFNHVLSELTIVVHPNYQGKGIGKMLFTELFNLIKTKKPEIIRIELIARESNKKAISFYESIGFKKEGRLEKRISNTDGTFEADIPMAWSR